MLRATLRVQSGWADVFGGEIVTLNCEIDAGEEGWTYSWYKNKTEISAIKQRDSSFEMNDTATFTCMGNQTVGNKLSTGMSDPLTLSVSGEFLYFCL